MATSYWSLAAPREVCANCASFVGPSFSSAPLQHPFESPLHRRQEPLTELERDSKVNEIKNDELEIDKLEKEIERLKVIQRAFEGRRDELKKHVENEKCLLVSPIRKLSDDVLSYIFVLAQDKFIGENDAAKNIDHVCSHWRVVAHATPRLWSDLDLCYGGLRLKSALRTLCKCIKLSGEVPMRLRFGQGEGSRPLPKPELLGDRCLRALAGSAHRWRTIDHLNFSIFRTVVGLMPEGSALNQLASLSIATIPGSVVIPKIPNLTHLSIEDIDDPNAKISLSSTLSLRSLKLDSLIYPLDLLPGFPWGIIEHFKSKRRVVYREGELHRMLHMMSDLTSIDIYDDSANAAPVMNLPQLRTFSVRNMHSALKSFTLPNLQNLRLSSFYDVSPRIKSQLLPFLQRSQCKIIVLMLHSPLLEIWKAQELSHVRKLCYGYNISNDFSIAELGWLNRTPTTAKDGKQVGGPLILPKLEVLEIGALTLSSDSDLAHLISMMQSRLRGGYSGAQEDDTTVYLKKVTVMFCETPDEYVRGWKAFCRSDILQISEVVWITQFGPW